MIERVPETAHYEVYNIKNDCNLAEFARKWIPGFKVGNGYGYYEFNSDEFIKPERRVVLIDKVQFISLYFYNYGVINCCCSL